MSITLHNTHTLVYSVTPLFVLLLHLIGVHNIDIIPIIRTGELVSAKKIRVAHNVATINKKTQN